LHGASAEGHCLHLEVITVATQASVARAVVLHHPLAPSRSWARFTPKLALPLPCRQSTEQQIDAVPVQGGELVLMWARQQACAAARKP